MDDNEHSPLKANSFYNRLQKISKRVRNYVFVPIFILFKAIKQKKYIIWAGGHGKYVLSFFGQQRNNLTTWRNVSSLHKFFANLLHDGKIWEMAWCTLFKLNFRIRFFYGKVGIGCKRDDLFYFCIF